MVMFIVYKVTKCYRNLHSKFEIDRTNQTCINQRKEPNVDVQTGRAYIQKVSLWKFVKLKHWPSYFICNFIVLKYSHEIPRHANIIKLHWISFPSNLCSDHRTLTLFSIFKHLFFCRALSIRSAIPAVLLWHSHNLS